MLNQILVKKRNQCLNNIHFNISVVFGVQSVPNLLTQQLLLNIAKRFTVNHATEKCLAQKVLVMEWGPEHSQCADLF